MARSTFSIAIPPESELDLEQIDYWFGGHDFYWVEFENGVYRTVVHAMGSPIYHKLKEHAGYKTYFKEAFGGALIVFEIKLENGMLEIQGYAPMMLFGFMSIETSFKEKASAIAKYRAEGYQYMESLKAFIEEKIQQT